VIYTIGPYLLPDLVKKAIERVPQMPLMLQENFTTKLLEMLRTGELDAAILAEPFPDSGSGRGPAVRRALHGRGAGKPPAGQAQEHHGRRAQAAETMLLLGTGHCFRDHVLEVCPEYARFSSRCRGHPQELRGQFAGDHQVHGGLGHGRDRGAAAQRAQGPQPHIRYVPFAAPVPTRRVVLAWRRSFTRYEAIAALRNAIYACPLPG
jgi:LysR family hydrogen peroxide-inducible transcriptional activator